MPDVVRTVGRSDHVRGSVLSSVTAIAGPVVVVDGIAPCYTVISIRFGRRTARTGYSTRPRRDRHSMPSPASRRIAAALDSRAGPDASASRVATTVVAMWRDVERQMTPIIGPRGIAALYGRSLYLTKRDFPWIGRPSDDLPETLDLTALHGALAAQGSALAAQGGTSLLHTFHALLESMVGSALTERLLHDVLLPPSSGDAAQDSGS